MNYHLRASFWLFWIALALVGTVVIWLFIAHGIIYALLVLVPSVPASIWLAQLIERYHIFKALIAKGIPKDEARQRSRRMDESTLRLVFPPSERELQWEQLDRHIEFLLSKRPRPRYQRQPFGRGAVIADSGIDTQSPLARNNARTKAAASSSAIVQPHRKFDCFVSYAGEDRSIARKLVKALELRDISVWWDKGQITIGDRLSQKIDEGLSYSRHGLVIVSPSFVEKRWTNAEIRALFNRAISSNQKILPVLVDMTHETFAATYPLLSDIVSAKFDDNIDALVSDIIRAMD